MQKKEIWRNVFVVSDILSADECQRYIDFTENIGYDTATVSTAMGPVQSLGIRNNTRVMFDNTELAKKLWERIKAFAPTVKFHQAVGLNERFRFYRYDPTQRFKLHSDGSFTHEDGRTSFYTFLVYLNDNFEGGATTFFVINYENGQPVKTKIPVEPKQGMGLFFEHSVLHEGSELISGRKYVLRTDVMYRST